MPASYRQQYTPYDDDGQPPALPCADKLVFDSRTQAAASANVVAYQHGSVVHPYRCRFCSLWHLASGADSYIS